MASSIVFLQLFQSYDKEEEIIRPTPAASPLFRQFSGAIIDAVRSVHGGRKAGKGRGNPNICKHEGRQDEGAPGGQGGDDEGV